MKKLIKLIGIIAFVAVIGFSMAGCEDSKSEPQPPTYGFTFNNMISEKITVNCEDFDPKTVVVEGYLMGNVKSSKPYADITIKYSPDVNVSVSGDMITLVSKK